MNGPDEPKEMGEHGEYRPIDERVDLVQRNPPYHLWLSVGATVIALTALFALISSAPWVSHSEHQDLINMTNYRDEELSKRIDALRSDLNDVRARQDDVRERLRVLESRVGVDTPHDH